MQKLISFDPSAEAKGQVLLAFISNVNASDILPILRRHRLDKVDAQQWYSLQPWLDVLRDLTDGTMNSVFNMVAIGIKTAEIVSTPPTVTTFEQILEGFNEGYQNNHRGDVGSVTTEHLGDQHYRVTFFTPYPTDFHYGIMQGMARRFKPGDKFVRVVPMDVDPNSPDHQAYSIFDVSW